MLTYWVLSRQKVQFSYLLYGTFKSAPGCDINLGQTIYFKSAPNTRGRISFMGHLEMAASYKRYSVREDTNVNELRIHTFVSELLSSWIHVLSLHETLTSYGSVYYIGTVIPIVLILLGR
ncbi:hypothetical protein K7X08_020504 [Anisodus acutangulus]|uniref:Uncharacterized protein n=1 Tax=Anisodus acutangulus TaxID=402998 RepID=A0A9Q1M758_9SOLA|nr:hypothetical protein K7X08_020504 [Anisodus acutangulus]